jgi:hypothetical protein
MPDPLAIQIGSTLPFSVAGPTINMGYNAPDPNALLNVINQITDPAPNSDYGADSFTFNERPKQCISHCIQAAFNTAQSQTATYPSANKLEIN